MSISTRELHSSKSKGLNPKNPYRDNPPSFRNLAKRYQPLQKFVKEYENGNTVIDFKQDGALEALTTALLKVHFHLNVKFPPGALIPTVNSRLEYLLWVDALVTKQPDQSQFVIDVGVGASCIYPLLGVCLDPWYKFIGTDSEKASREFAEENIRANFLENRISIVDATPHMLPLKAFPEDTAFTVCNPPFYKEQESEEADVEMKDSNEKAKALPPSAASTGNKNEMKTRGGTVGFVKRLIHESFVVSQNCQWFTVWIGRKADLVSLVEILLTLQVKSVVWTTFEHGFTRRWGLAWSFTRSAKEAATRALVHDAKDTMPQLLENVQK